MQATRPQQLPIPVDHAHMVQNAPSFLVMGTESWGGGIPIFCGHVQPGMAWFVHRGCLLDEAFCACTHQTKASGDR